MKRQATYQPPFNCWRLPSAKAKSKKERKERKKRPPQPSPTTTTPGALSHTSSSSEDNFNVDPETASDHSNTPAQAAVRAPAVQIPVNPHYTSLDPYGALAGAAASAGTGTGTLEDIGRWWHYRQPDEMAARRFDSATRFWVDGLWNLARVNETIFTCLTAFAASKMSKLTGVDACKTNLIVKGRILELVSKQLPQVAEGKADGVTFVAMSVLALLDMRDGELETARKHLQALRQLIRPEQMTGREWLYCVWVDLRYAIIRRMPPFLPFFVPLEFRSTPPECLQYRTEAQKLALRNAKGVPSSDHFSFGQMFMQFRKLHELGLAWEELYDSAIPPFGQVYDLDYQLLTQQAALWARPAAMSEQPDGITDALLLQAMQLHVWLLSRFWVPQKRITYISILTQANALLQAHANDIVRLWRARSDDISGLLWILFTVTCLALEFLRPAEPLGIQLLTDVTNDLNLRREGDFARALQKWPWIERWHGPKVTVLWARIRARLNVNIQRWQKVADEAGPAATTHASPDHHYFVGGFEFYAAG